MRCSPLGESSSLNVGFPLYRSSTPIPVTLPRTSSQDMCGSQLRHILRAEKKKSLTQQELDELANGNGNGNGKGSLTSPTSNGHSSLPKANGNGHISPPNGHSSLPSKGSNGNGNLLPPRAQSPQPYGESLPLHA